MTPTLTACTHCGHANHRNTPACTNCGRPRRRNLTTTQRGYGTTHQHTRAALLLTALGRPCPICDQTMQPGDRLDLDHSMPLILSPYQTTGDRIVHAHCNRGAGVPRRSAAVVADPASFPRETVAFAGGPNEKEIGS